MPDRILYLLRHAKSDWDDHDLEDRERPLAPRGERDAKRLAKYMKREKIQPDLVLCSPAKRARQTVELLEPGLGKDRKPVFEDKLYGASDKDLLKRITQVPGSVKSVMLVGHNPTMQELALHLASSGSGLQHLRENLATCGLVTLAVRCDTWKGIRPGAATLTSYVTPRDL